MQLVLRAGSTECDYESGGSPSASRRTRQFLMAGVAMASASVLAVNPVAPTPAVPDIREVAVELAAFSNPLTEWQQTIANTLTHLNRLSTDVPAASTALTQALTKPSLAAEFASFLTANPLTLLTALANLPEYSDRLSSGLQELISAQQGGLTTLPTVLLNSLGLLAQGEFLEAYSELNLFLLVDVLENGRTGVLDALRVPGDLLESIGLGPLGRILGTSWMAAPRPDGQLAGPGLLGRTMVGNFGRAVLAPQVTAIIQTAEILDRAREALQAGDVGTALGELINAPAKIVNAFLNGYVPQFILDGELTPGLPPQAFPGFFSPTGTIGFFFVQVPNEIARTLNLVPPAPASVPAAPSTMAQQASVTDIPVSSNSVMLTVDIDGTTALGETGGVTDDAPGTTPGGGNDGLPGDTSDDDTSDGDEATGDDDTTGDDDDTTGDDAYGDDDDGDGDTTGGGTNGGTTGGGTTGGSDSGGASGGGTTGGSDSDGASGGGTSGDGE